jgi:hypothetical protein
MDIILQQARELLAKLELLELLEIEVGRLESIANSMGYETIGDALRALSDHEATHRRDAQKWDKR